MRLKDVARIELGSENYGTLARFNTHPATGIAIKMATGANALDTAVAVQAKIDDLSKFFPPGMKAIVAYDTTPYVRLSIEEVVKTLFEAIVLVFLVMYLFLQNFRATLIPTIAVPVVLLGTFGVLNACGFSINTLTMFAMVLAIGLLVDDAIVVVENVERVMTEEGLSPKEATQKSMGSDHRRTGRHRAGAVGRIYPHGLLRRLGRGDLSPVLHHHRLGHGAVGYCRPDPDPRAVCHHAQAGRQGRAYRASRLLRLVQPRVRPVEQRLSKLRSAASSHRSAPYLIIYAVVVVAMGGLFLHQASGFLPDEDQGVLYGQIVLPAGATQERTLKVIEQVEHHFLVDEKDNVATMFGVAGYSFGGSGQNAGLTFVRLKPWDRAPASRATRASRGRTSHAVLLANS